jgi:hypothetical protein
MLIHCPTSTQVHAYESAAAGGGMFEYTLDAATPESLLQALLQGVVKDALQRMAECWNPDTRRYV